MSHQYISFILSLLASASLLSVAAEPASQPDFTKGGKIPENAKHDWNLGSTGLRQVSVTEVAVGSPAEGKFVIGDVILGIAGKPFSQDPRVEIGKALTAAESDTGKGKLSLIRWRAGKEEEVVLEIPVLGNYSNTAPYDCPKSARILEEGCKALAVRMQQEDYPKGQNPITRPLNALALLASGKPEYLPLIRRECEWASKLSDGSSWWNAFPVMLLAEYKIATGDDAFTAGMNRIALETTKGQSMVGSWGHNYALPSGNLSGYGMMNVTGVPLTISLILAREAGLKDPAVGIAIERSAKLLRFYIGKGSIPYGDHHPWTQNHDDNGKNGMTGVMFNMLGEKDGAEYFSRMSVAAHGAERDCGHCGNFTNLLWAMPGVALSGPQATGAWMQEFGARHFDMSRTQDFRFPHPGAPEPNGDSYRGWDNTGGYLLALAMPLKKIMLTGKKPNIAPQIDAATAASLIADGRGWSMNDRYSVYDKFDINTLLEKLGSWSPTVRERAAIAISRRQGDKPVSALKLLLDSPNLFARYGACEALILLNAAAAPAVPQLTALLKHEDMWLRIKAAEVLARIGAPALPALPLLMDRLSQGPTESDPRGMEQRYLCFALFDSMLRNSLDNVDRELLNKAIKEGLRNEDGRARSSISNIYKLLSAEEIKPLLPAILDSVSKPAPSGEMFSDQIRVEGLKTLAQHRIEEGMTACVDYILNQNIWASQIRTPELLNILVTYGANAKSVLPQLNQAAEQFDKGVPGFPPHMSVGKAAAVRKAIADIQAATDKPVLIKIK
jgi:HEAT repeat protein